MCRHKRSEVCVREGCDGPAPEGMAYCSAACYAVDAELDKAERLCHRVGPGALTTEFWLSATDLGTALSRYLALHAQMRQAVEQGGRQCSTVVRQLEILT